MNLKQLEAFVQVAEGGSFSKAAKQLFLTQPTISAHISSLEKELNARLFVRNTKEVKLSDDGKDLYRYARQMIDLQKKIEERFETGKEESKHLITIAASTIPAQYLLPKILMKFNERYPKEQVKLLETDSSQVVTQIIDHMVDVGFTGTVLEKKHCKYIPFYKDELVVITPKTRNPFPTRNGSISNGLQKLWKKGLPKENSKVQAPPLNSWISMPCTSGLFYMTGHCLKVNSH